MDFHCRITFTCVNKIEVVIPVPDPDLEITGGGGHLDPEIRAGPSLQNIFFGPTGISLV